MLYLNSRIKSTDSFIDVYYQGTGHCIYPFNIRLYVMFYLLGRTDLC